ncbi:putative SNF2 family helicase/ATPase [Talaromyces proteolyticus]|uniref:SNF2 family helicase/ATPase n=1 Tax=Talaromyces proteolyticus TaxID=1131652 RepID=A0AAD4L2V6_9EURO|nr:putative SNF2 family helicase/ATPase [Talaromyces proteolyticus]KAH8704933.1 putative SNF2 family helicase/ATPase [Talaromyces proteolyticus]
MVNEINPPRGHPLLPRKANEQTKESASPQPEFGKPTPLRSQQTQAQAQLPFNIPKSNQPRVEHHRPGPNHQSTQLNKPQASNNTHYREPFNPFKPVVPSAYTSHRTTTSLVDDDVVEIPRPTQHTWTTKQAPLSIFSSKPSVPKVSNASKTLKNFIDLTNDSVGFQGPSASQSFQAPSYPREEFGSIDAYSYVDSAQAQENIKALLEGAFEDEDDKPRTRARKKKIEADINDLASKLEKVSVGQKSEDNQEDDAESEDEEEVDDGTREGLKVKLLPHQIEGVEWMCDKENGQKKTRGVLPKGGVLADDMGLGKTVQSITLILTNPKPTYEKNGKESAKVETKKKEFEGVDKGTLIVAPLALIKQWESEIESKIERSHKLSVCVYHGANRSKFSNDLKKYDVVITTYGTLSSEHAASGKGKVGCFKVHWYRIILDEAHTIKNRNAKATHAACALEAQYRWCLTGTPLQNNLDELQSLIKFLRIKPYDDLASWRDQITRPLNNGRGGLAIKRLQVYLKAFMKRRTKDVLKLNGSLKPGEEKGEGDGKKKSSTGFQITKREVIEIESDFSPAELEFYNRLEQRTDRRLSQMMGSKLNYASALVMLLRLRQACNHPDLVNSDLAEDKDVLLNNAPKGAKSQNQVDVDNIVDLLGGLSVVNKKCDICQADLTSAESNSGSSRCGECADLDVDFTKIRKKNKKKIKKQEKHASKSRSDRRDPEPCKDRSRRNRKVIDDSDDEEDGDWVVPKSQRIPTDLGKAGGSDDEDAEGGGDWIGSEDSNTEDEVNEVISISSSQASDEDEDEDEEEDEESDAYGNGEATLLPSTKIQVLMKILKREAPEFKFIVFSVFTTMLDKIEPFLKRANLGYARYDGGMRNDLREASLEQLRNRPSTRVLLCSLRAGSLGLNLTAASRVVILEPFWNPFVEEQAIDRVHRLNQTVDVKIYKMTIKETVEARILALQERKRELANATIEGKTAAGKLTMRDMMALFGRDAEARFEHERDAPDLSQKTRLLSKDDDDTASYGDAYSASSSQLNLQDARRKQTRDSSRSEDSVYGRRW